jgi:monoamine oxidase
VIDLAIVGAGAAGISAAREARRRGLSYTILEAANRVGGRAHSVEWRGRHLDLGAGWLHSANRNPLVPLAEQLDLSIDRAQNPWRGQYQALGFARDDQEAAYAAFAEFEEQVSAPQQGDVAANALSPGGPWNAFIDALSGYLNGTSLRCMSAVDYAAYSNASNRNNWRLHGSYGSLIAALSEGLAIEFGSAVTEVDWDGQHVRLSTSRGSVVARSVIVAISSTVLASGSVRFVPEIADHLHAAAQLPLGHVEKMFFALDEAQEFPNDAHLIGDPHSSDTGSYMLRPLGMPVLEGFFGGEWVAGASYDDIEAMARKELGALLGSAFLSRIHRIAESGWKDDPLFGGSYSYARPGQHGARRQLAQPVADRIAFAGEACSEVDFSTVHGAWESGIAAVEKLFGEFHDAH